MSELAQKVLSWVTDAGAKGDLIISEGQALSLKARDGELEEHKVSSSQVFGVRVIRDDRAGVAYSESADEAMLKSMVDQALANATFARSDPDEQIADLDDQTALCTDDAQLAPTDQVSVEEKIEAALHLERALAAKKRVKNVPYNGVSDVTSAQHVYSTAGLDASSRVRMCFSNAAALVEDGEHNVLEGWGHAARRFPDLDIDGVIEQAYANCMELLYGEAIPTGHYDLIFDPQWQSQLFGTFSMMFSGRSAKDGINPMRDRLGETIADSRLSVFDSPLLADGFGYALFDDEGCATSRTPLIESGVLSTLVHNSATGRHFGIRSTGHAARSPRGMLDVGLHQLEIGAGTAHDSELHAGQYLLITDLTGTHSGANPIAGDFSFGASGFLCQDGERGQPVRNITVAGNFYKMLEQIALIGSSRAWDLNRSAFMPALRFADVAVGGS